MRASRPFYVALRAPALADRRGLRWLLSDRLWPVPVMVLRHRGRRSGRRYATPVEAIAESRERGRVVISPMRGAEGDWYRNLIAGGLVEVGLHGERFEADWRRLDEGEAAEATREYLDAHPRYARLVARSLMRLHGLEGDPIAELPRALPMLELTLRPKEG
ncbi:MAG: nitroreductase family deazaflavin-dependent oxidoreductase [Solirubrobacterales bacterium]